MVNHLFSSHSASGRCSSKLEWKENWIKVFTHPAPSTISETSDLCLFSYLYSSCSHLTPSFFCMIYTNVPKIESRSSHIWHNLALWLTDYVFHICIKVCFGRLWTNLFKMYFYSLTGLCRLVQQDFDFSESVKWFPPSLLLAYLTNISRFHTHFVSKSYQSIKDGEIWIIGATGYICSKRQCNIIEYCWNIKPHINHAVNIWKGQSIFWFWFLWKQHWQ